jgi:hypothetical protein
MNCVVYLVRSSEQDVNDFNRSLNLLENNLIRFTQDVDILIFCEKSFEDYKPRIATSLPLKYQEIEFNIPGYSKDILDSICEYYPHPTHGNGPIAWGHPGFTLGYRHMCRFFSGEIYKHDVFKNYDYYLRLDTDSFLLTPLNYDIFKWAIENECYYGYIAPAVQKDNPKVIEGLWETVNKIIPNNIEEGLMYYTNFELGKTSWFTQNEYMEFYDHLDKTGGFFTKRWGDAPIKYLAVNLLMNPKNIFPVHGFTYQHGAVYSV